MAGVEDDSQDLDGGGGDAGDARRLADGAGLRALEGFADLVTETGDGLVVEIVGDGKGLVVSEGEGFLFLSVEIAGVSGVNDDLFEGFRIPGGEGGIEGLDRREIGVGAREELEEGGGLSEGFEAEEGGFLESCVSGVDLEGSEVRTDRVDGLHLVFKAAPAGIIDEADLAAEGGESAIGIVFAQEEAILGAGGEHAVGFGSAPCGEVIDHDGDIGLGAVEEEGFAFGGFEGGIDPGEESLSGGFFVAACAVDLSGEKEVGDGLQFEPREEAARIDGVVLDGVAVVNDLGVFEADDRVNQVFLGGGREAGADAIGVDQIGREGDRFKEDLVSIAVGEANDFVFDARAVAGSETFDLAAIHGGLVEVLADRVVSTGVGVGDMARDLAEVSEIRGKEGEGEGRIVAGLFFEDIEADGLAIEARRGSGFEADQGQAEACEVEGKGVARGFIDATAGGALKSGVEESAQEGSGGDDDSFGEDDGRIGQEDASDLGVAEVKSGDLGGDHGEVGGVSEDVRHPGGVGEHIGLSAAGLDSGTLAGIEAPELDPGGVGSEGHLAAKSVDLADDLAFADAADSGVARHPSGAFGLGGDDSGLAAHTGGSEGGFAARVPSTDDENIKARGHGRDLPRMQKTRSSGGRSGLKSA